MFRDDDLRAGVEQLEAGRPALAVEHFAEAADNAADEDERRAAMAFAADATLKQQRPYEAIAWTERLRAEGGPSGEADLLEGAAWVALRDGGEALRRLEGLEPPRTPYRQYPASVVAQLRCEAHGLVGDAEAAKQAAREAVTDDWQLPEVWRAMVPVAADHEVDVASLLAHVPDEGVMQVLGWISSGPASGIDRFVEVLWDRAPGDRRILALMTSVANRLALDRALVWSARLRAAGLEQECAVLGRAAREDLPGEERVRAAAVAASAFQDPRAEPLIEVAVASVPDDDLRRVFSEVLEIGTDGVVDAFVVAASSSPVRAFSVAAELVERGAMVPACALARHGLALSTGDPEGLRDAVQAALPPAAVGALVAELEASGEHQDAEALRLGSAS